MAANTGMSIDEWISHDQYWQEAIYQAVKSMVEIRNKKSQEESDKILKQINASSENSPYVSPFATVPKPTFQMG